MPGEGEQKGGGSWVGAVAGLAPMVAVGCGDQPNVLLSGSLSLLLSEERLH